MRHARRIAVGLTAASRAKVRAARPAWCSIQGAGGAVVVTHAVAVNRVSEAGLHVRRNGAHLQHLVGELTLFFFATSWKSTRIYHPLADDTRKSYLP